MAEVSRFKRTKNARKNRAVAQAKESALMLETTPPPIMPPAGVTLFHALMEHDSWVSSVTWSPDGKMLASSSYDNTVRLWESETGKLLHTFHGHTAWVRSVVWSPDGRLLVSSSDDKTVRIWDIQRGAQIRVLSGHTSWVSYTVWSPNGKRLASVADDGTVRLWDALKGEQLHILDCHANANSDNSVMWSPSGKRLASGSNDGVVHIWDTATGALISLLGGHTGRVNAIAWSPDGRQLASGASDTVVRIWNVTRKNRAEMLVGHASEVYTIAWSPDGKQLASGSSDSTVRLWNATTRKQLHTLEGHTGQVSSVRWSPDGRLLLSCAVEISIWRADSLERLVTLPSLNGFRSAIWHPQLPLVTTMEQREKDITIWRLDLEILQARISTHETAHYANAKVVLVGDSGVGKSGLGLVLSGQPFSATESTHARRVWPFDSQQVALDERRHETRETLLWDLAGQPGYRLIHQLHLNEVAVALVVFDAHSETDPFAGVYHWDRALRQAQRVQGNSPLPLKKLLVAARVDRGGAGVSAERIQMVVDELGFDGYFATSARDGWQIHELHEAILQAIAWDELPKISSTLLFQQIKNFLFAEKQRGRRLISTVDDLYSMFLASKDAPQETADLPAQFEACIGRVESSGLIKRLSFGNLVLLQPELLDAYASALVNAVRDEPDGLGSISEDLVRQRGFRISEDERIKDGEQEKLLLLALIEDLFQRELILREDGMLVFPSQSTKEYPDLSDPQGTVIFSFEGPVANIYSTLVVRLAHSGSFKKKDLWKNAVTYTSIGGTCGLYLRNMGEGRGELILFFDPATSLETRQRFEEYVYWRLEQGVVAETLKVRRVLSCDACKTPIPDEMIQRRRERNLDWLNCPVCDNQVSLVEHGPQTMIEPSLQAQKMDQAADRQREREAAQSMLQGKIATGDFDVFLCHHGVDKLAVKRIGELLKERGILPWLDEWELRPGLPWQDILEEQLESIKAAAVFVGKEGIGPWQQRELSAFLREFANRRCPVIPVLLPEAPQQPKLPRFLKEMTWVDFRTREPEPLQRLVWGITGERA